MKMQKSIFISCKTLIYCPVFKISSSRKSQGKGLSGMLKRTIYHNGLIVDIDIIDPSCNLYTVLKIVVCQGKKTK